MELSPSQCSWDKVESVRVRDNFKTVRLTGTSCLEANALVMACQGQTQAERVIWLGWWKRPQRHCKHIRVWSPRPLSTWRMLYDNHQRSKAEA